jgi:hypothetical protein
MSQLLIQHYLNELQTLRRVSGTSRESVVSEAFKTLLKDWGRSRDLIFGWRFLAHRLARPARAATPPCSRVENVWSPA